MLNLCCRPKNVTDEAASMRTLITVQPAIDVQNLQQMVHGWETRIKEHDSRFLKSVDDSVEVAALLSMSPTMPYQQRFQGQTSENYAAIRSQLTQ